MASPCVHRDRPDCDSPEAAKELEVRFPVLNQVPCAQTKKGFHYYFKRSPMANAGGFYDCSGYAQCLKDVDFKTVTSTGTGGVSTPALLCANAHAHPSHHA